MKGRRDPKVLGTVGTPPTPATKDITPHHVPVGQTPLPANVDPAPPHVIGELAPPRATPGTTPHPGLHLQEDSVPLGDLALGEDLLKGQHPLEISPRRHILPKHAFGTGIQVPAVQVPEQHQLQQQQHQLHKLLQTFRIPQVTRMKRSSLAKIIPGTDATRRS